MKIKPEYVKLAEERIAGDQLKAWPGSANTVRLWDEILHHGSGRISGTIVVAHLLVPAPYDWTQTRSASWQRKAMTSLDHASGLYRLRCSGLLWAVRRVAVNPRRNWPEIGVLIYGLAILLSGVFRLRLSSRSGLLPIEETCTRSWLPAPELGSSLAMLCCGLLNSAGLQGSSTWLRWRSPYALVPVGALPSCGRITQRALYIWFWLA